MITLIRTSGVSSGVLSSIKGGFADRRIVVALTATGIVGGLAFNWTWLTAIGRAPLLLSVLPCVAMCALGLCMSRMTGRSCQAGADTGQMPVPTKDEAMSCAPAWSPQVLPDRSLNMPEGRRGATNSNS
ncbi:MAG: hypothetical protein J0H84_17005 [Rhizobiales bacterium]|nr:hypothetical protein [Hyphomicrobiales bacterium]